MKRITFFLVALLFSTQANAGLISVGGPLSTAGCAASIIAAPAFATNAAVTNCAQEGFDEMQGVLLAGALAVDGGGFIAAGTLVDSHMIFLNNPGGGVITHNQVLWTFSGAVLGVMSDPMGNFEALSTAILGAAGTTYEGPFNARGMEGADGYGFAGNTLLVNMVVSQPGDWIRVVTTNVPEPSTLILLGLGLAGLGLGFGRRNYKLS